MRVGDRVSDGSKAELSPVELTEVHPSSEEVKAESEERGEDDRHDLTNCAAAGRGQNLVRTQTASRGGASFRDGPCVSGNLSVRSSSDGDHVGKVRGVGKHCPGWKGDRQAEDMSSQRARKEEHATDNEEWE